MAQLLLELDSCVKMVDYSKWDKFEVSDEESDEEFHPPKVTKLSGESIRITSTGPELIPTKQNWTSSSRVTEIPDFQTLDFSELWANGSAGENFHWDQSHNEVTVRIDIPESAQSKHFKVRMIESKKLSIEYNDTLYFEKDFHFGIECADSVDTDTNLFSDWELLTACGRRYLVLTVRKKSLIAGTRFWWDRAFTGEIPIDVTKLRARGTPQTLFKGRSGMLTGQTAAFGGEEEDVWTKAHRMFIDKISTRSPIEVDVDSGDDTIDTNNLSGT